MQDRAMGKVRGIATVGHQCRVFQSRTLSFVALVAGMQFLHAFRIGLAPGCFSGAAAPRPTSAAVKSAHRTQPKSRELKQLRAVPDWWDTFWKLPALQPGQPGTPIGSVDLLRGLKAGIEEQYMDAEPAEGIPLASQTYSMATTGGNIFQILRSNFDAYGPIYKTRLNVASAVNVADPAMIRHILTNSGSYDKGVLGLVSEDIFGQGLITATDREVWKSRRQVVAPGFHKRWLAALTSQFAHCTSQVFASLDESAAYGEVVDMESAYLNLGLDIVGKAVFNVDFQSASTGGKNDKQDASVVSAVYRVLKETGYRAENPALLLLAQLPAEVSALLPEARNYRESLDRLNQVLDDAINEAMKADSETLGIEELQERVLNSAADVSLLRFLLDTKGQDASSKQLKDDLRTILIAGHETVASVMTWATFELARHPEIVASIREELDRVLGDRDPTLEDVNRLEYLRLVITETLRKYPAPPILARRALQDDELPGGSAAGSVHIKRGTLMILQMAMLHRNPDVYEDPDVFRPERWTRAFGANNSVPGWKGFDPARVTGLCANEFSTDFAFVPFGAGEFKCVGDQFAMLEATVVLAMLIRRYDFTVLAKSIDEVGLDIAATIHPRSGLLCKVSKRIV